MLIKETNRTVSVNSVATNREFTYNVNYNMQNEKISRLHCDVLETVSHPMEAPGGEIHHTEQQIHLGYIILESGNKHIVLNENADIVAHVATFDAILYEIKESIIENKD